MSGGTGVGFVDDGLNLLTNLSTGGLAGYGENGFSTDKGYSQKFGALKVYKDISGATAAEEANNLARQQYEDSVTAAREQRENAITQNARNQMTASQNAGAARSFSNNNTTTNTSRVTGDVSDFLGL